MKREIFLKMDYKAGCWTCATCVDEAPDPEIMALFGTHVLPTAFTLKASARQVEQSVRDLNPGAYVYS